MAHEFKRGDLVMVDRHMSKPCKVMGVIDGYAMLRFPRAMPFVESVKHLTPCHGIELSTTIKE